MACLVLLTGRGIGADESSSVRLQGVHIDAPSALVDEAFIDVSGKLQVAVPVGEPYAATYLLYWKNHNSGESGTARVSVAGTCVESWAVVVVFPVPVLECSHDDTWKVSVPLVGGGNGISVRIGSKVTATTVQRNQFLNPGHELLHSSLVAATAG